MQLTKRPPDLFLLPVHGVTEPLLVKEALFYDSRRLPWIWAEESCKGPVPSQRKGTGGQPRMYLTEQEGRNPPDHQSHCDPCLLFIQVCVLYSAVLLTGKGC